MSGESDFVTGVPDANSGSITVFRIAVSISFALSITFPKSNAG